MVAGSDALAAHLAACSQCRRFRDDQHALSAAVGILRVEAADENPSPESLSALLAEFDAAVAAKQRVKRMPWLWAAGAIAASVAAALLLLPSRPSAKPVPAVARAAVAVRPAEVVSAPVAKMRHPSRRRRARVPSISETQFLQIPYTLPLAPYERASVMRMELPAAALIAAGVPVAAANAGALVRADVIVSEDGQARAVRLLSVSDN
ncbi:MAG TPA: hypothetical protein VHB50_02400 [Bryobacteraceae bacterium]|nr:hypothetical protein [Bryobacteraceae bacterium]